MIIRQDPKTNAMLFAAFDGHGKVGHMVSQYFRSSELPVACLEVMCAYVLALMP